MPPFGGYDLYLSLRIFAIKYFFIQFTILNLSSFKQVMSLASLGCIPRFDVAYIPKLGSIESRDC
jgi:hypothetical protein